MARFPDEVLTRTKRGEVEVRSLVDRGRYVRYEYLHPETGARMEGGKVKLVLVAESGSGRSTSSSRRRRVDLLVLAADKGDRKLWDGTRAVDL